jgi:hypothetical protein
VIGCTESASRAQLPYHLINGSAGWVHRPLLGSFSLSENKLVCRMMKSIRRRRSRKSKTVDTPLVVDDDSSSRGDSSQIENMGALETPPREQNAAFEEKNKTSKFDKGTPATDITDLVESDEDDEIYEVSSVSSGELMQRRRSAAKTVKKPVFIQDELEALRTRQLARNLRKDLQDAEKKTNVAVTFAAVDAESFYLQQREQNKAWKKKQEDSRNYLNSYRGAAESAADTPPRKSPKKYSRAANPSAATSEMDQFYSKQKAMNNDWKQKQRDANALLHQYRGYSDEKEQIANFTFEELVSWQMQAAGVPLPDSPIIFQGNFCDDNSDEIIATAPLPCLDASAPLKRELGLSTVPPATKDAREDQDVNRRQRGSVAHQPLSGMADILDEVGEILVEMEEMSKVDVVDGTTREAGFFTPIASQLSHESGESLSLPEDEMPTKESVLNTSLAVGENDATKELANSRIVDLDEPLADKDGICENSEERGESASIPGFNDFIIKGDDDKVEDVSELPGSDAPHVDAAPTMEEDNNVKQEADALEEPFAVDLVETFPVEHWEQHMVVDLDDEAGQVDHTFKASDELDGVLGDVLGDVLDDMLDGILDIDEASPDDQLETAAMDAAVVGEALSATTIIETPIALVDDPVMEIQSHPKAALKDSPQTDNFGTQPQKIGMAAAIEGSRQKVAKNHTQRTSQTPPQRVTSTNTPTRISRIVTPRSRWRSDDDSTACSTLSSPKIPTARYDDNSPSRLRESIAASRSARRGRHRLSDLSSYSPRKASVPIYSRQSGKFQKCCTGQLVLDLHVKLAGCERCLHFASPSEKLKYDEEGHHYRVNIVRGGCSRKCKLFPREEKEPPVRLCRQCFYDTHTHGKV